MKDGEELHGCVIYRDEGELAVATNAYDFADLTKVASSEVASVALSPSMMPPNAIGQMNADEVRDLIAYLISGGNRRHKVFQGADLAVARASQLPKRPRRARLCIRAAIPNSARISWQYRTRFCSAPSFGEDPRRRRGG